MGAFGAALIAKKDMTKPCDNFAKRAVADLSINTSVTRCRGCSNNCLVTVTALEIMKDLSPADVKRALANDWQKRASQSVLI